MQFGENASALEETFQLVGEHRARNTHDSRMSRTCRIKDYVVFTCTCILSSHVNAAVLSEGRNSNLEVTGAR